jgi:hypothetical protein
MPVKETMEIAARVKRLQAHKRGTTNLGQVLQDHNGCRIGDLWFDGEIRDLKEVWCAILGRIRYRRSSQTEIKGLSYEGEEGEEGEEGWKYYVLIVMELERVADGYYRVGAGVVDQGCISFEDNDKPVRIV